MLNFTVGPVQMNDEIRKIGAEQVPYFRTEEFSKIILESEALIKKFTNAPDGSRAVFLTGSGTAAMESVVTNTLSQKDKVLIVNGGSFGKRFVDLCKIHGIPFDQIQLPMGKTLSSEMLDAIDGTQYSAFLVNIHETSTGVHYNLDLIHRFCEQYDLFLVVDAISSFLADDNDMTASGIDVLITGSQKALACPPGVSIVVLSEQAIKQVRLIAYPSVYLSLSSALINGERGQTPFTPAVGILRQIHARLLQIEADGGMKVEQDKIHLIAADFRMKIQNLPFRIVSESLSNAVTPLTSTNGKSAYDIFLCLKDNYHIWVCPNGGDMKEKVFRVGHIGALSTEDNSKLIDALKDMESKKII
jgi:aspartate aminotransferase-like enzyme